MQLFSSKINEEGNFSEYFLSGIKSNVVTIQQYYKNIFKK